MTLITCKDSSYWLALQSCSFRGGSVELLEASPPTDVWSSTFKSQNFSLHVATVTDDVTQFFMLSWKETLWHFNVSPFFCQFRIKKYEPVWSPGFPPDVWPTGTSSGVLWCHQAWSDEGELTTCWLDGSLMFPVSSRLHLLIAAVWSESNVSNVRLFAASRGANISLLFPTSIQ